MKTFNPWSLIPLEHQPEILAILYEEADFNQAEAIKELIKANPKFKTNLDKVPLDPGYFAYALIHTYNLTQNQ